MYRFELGDVGLYVESEWHRFRDVVDVAYQAGWNMTPVQVAIMAAGWDAHDHDVQDRIRDMADDALAFLESSTAPGLEWVWDQGNLILREVVAG